MLRHAINPKKFSLTAIAATFALAFGMLFAAPMHQSAEAGNYYSGKKAKSSYRSVNRYRSSSSARVKYRHKPAGPMVRNRGKLKIDQPPRRRHFAYSHHGKKHFRNDYRRNSGQYYAPLRKRDGVKTKRYIRGRTLIIQVNPDQESNNAYTPCPQKENCYYSPSQHSGGPTIIRLGDPALSDSPKIIVLEDVE